MTGALQWFGTWALVIMVFYGLSKTRWGQPIVYGMLWLALVLLVVSHADEITNFVSLKALQLNG